MQSYGGAVSAPYTAYIYAQPQPGHGVQNGPGPVYGAAPPLAPLQYSQSSRYDPPLPLPNPGSFAARLGGPPVIPPDPRAPRPRRFTQRASEPSKRQPLKSAMKKTDSSGPNGDLRRSHTAPVGDSDGHRGRNSRPTAANVSRGRSVSGSESQPRATSVSRVRSRSRSRYRYTPGHLFLSLGGTSRMDLSSVIFQTTVDGIRDRVLPMWPDGVLFQTYYDDVNEYKIQFSGNPWTARSTVGLMAMKMILEVFAVLARQGYSCISSIDTGRSISAPRLVFARGQPDPYARFGMIIFSNSRRTMKVVNHSHEFCEGLTKVLRENFPRRIRSAIWNDDDVYIVEMSNLDFDKIVDLLIAITLEHAAEVGHKLEATIPLPRSTFWSLFRGRRELWIFRLPQGDEEDMDRPT